MVSRWNWGCLTVRDKILTSEICGKSEFLQKISKKIKDNFTTCWFFPRFLDSQTCHNAKITSLTQQCLKSHLDLRLLSFFSLASRSQAAFIAYNFSYIREKSCHDFSLETQQQQHIQPVYGGKRFFPPSPRFYLKKILRIMKKRVKIIVFSLSVTRICLLFLHYT